MYGEEPAIEAAGQANELALLTQKNPELEAISVGPMIEYPDTPNETLYLDTVRNPQNGS